MKKMFFITLIGILFTSCVRNENTGIIGGSDGPTSIIISQKGENKMFQQISQDEAKRIIDLKEEYILIDVREQEEYNEGHIKGAILIPYTEIESKVPEMLPDKNKRILVYCRSGRRSKIAAQMLAELGYTNVLEFGGIIDWKYEVVK